MAPGPPPNGETAPPTRLKSHLFWLLRSGARLTEEAVAARAEELGIARGAYGVLAALDEFGPAAQRTLGRRLGIDPSDLVALLGSLEDAGWIRRTRDATDRRRNSVVISAKGHAELERWDRTIQTVEGELTASLSAPERKKLRELLLRLLETSA